MEFIEQLPQSGGKDAISVVICKFLIIYSLGNKKVLMWRVLSHIIGKIREMLVGIKVISVGGKYASNMGIFL